MLKIFKRKEPVISLAEHERVKHGLLADAQREAALHEAYRLAGLFPGREFFVMMQASRPCVVQPEQVSA